MPPKGMSQAAVQALVAASVAEALAKVVVEEMVTMGEMEGTLEHALIRTS